MRDETQQVMAGMHLAIFLDEVFDWCDWHDLCPEVSRDVSEGGEVIWSVCIKGRDQAGWFRLDPIRQLCLSTRGKFSEEVYRAKVFDACANRLARALRERRFANGSPPVAGKSRAHAPVHAH